MSGSGNRRAQEPPRPGSHPQACKPCLGLYSFRFHHGPAQTTVHSPVLQPPGRTRMLFQVDIVGVAQDVSRRPLWPPPLGAEYWVGCLLTLSCWLCGRGFRPRGLWAPVPGFAGVAFCRGRGSLEGPLGLSSPLSVIMGLLPTLPGHLGPGSWQFTAASLPSWGLGFLLRRSASCFLDPSCGYTCTFSVLV